MDFETVDTSNLAFVTLAQDPSAVSGALWVTPCLSAPRLVSHSCLGLRIVSKDGVEYAKSHDALLHDRRALAILRLPMSLAKNSSPNDIVETCNADAAAVLATAIIVAAALVTAGQLSVCGTVQPSMFQESILPHHTFTMTDAPLCVQTAYAACSRSFSFMIVSTVQEVPVIESWPRPW